MEAWGICYDKNPNYAFHHLLIACACGHAARKYQEQRTERLSFQRNGCQLPLVWLQMCPCPQHPAPHSTEGCGLGGARLIQSIWEMDSVEGNNILKIQLKQRERTNQDPLHIFIESHSLIKVIKKPQTSFRKRLAHGMFLIKFY